MVAELIAVDPDDPVNANPQVLAWFRVEELTSAPLRDELTTMLPRLLPLLTHPPEAGVAVKDVAGMFIPSAPDNTGGPGVRGAEKDGVSAGVTVATGIQGSPLAAPVGTDDDEDDEDAAKALMARVRERTVELLQPDIDRLVASATRVDAARITEGSHRADNSR